VKPEFAIYFFWILFAGVIVHFLYRAMKNRGFKGAMFGAPIARTVGELDLGRTGPMRTTLKVHHLQAREPGTPTVGIEVVNRSVVSFHMLPIRLTSDQAASLRELLLQAMSGP